MDHDEAAVLQQMVDLVVEGQATETSAAAGAVAEDKMQLLIREGMALLSSSSDFDATVASPEMQALIDKAKDLWAELGDEEATAQVLSLQGTMDHDEAAVLQQMVDLVVFGAEGGQEELEPTAVIVGEEANEEGEGESAQGADDVPGSSAVAAGEGSVVVDDQTGVVHAGADEGGAGAGGQREAEQEVPATTASQAEGKRTEESTTEELRQEQDFVVKRKQAAVAVQCALRGRRARVHVQEMRQKAAWQTQCAVRIQAVVRGHGGRRQAQSVRGQQTAEKEEGKEEQEGQAAAQLKEEEETGGVEGDAATRSEIEELTLMLAEAERKQALEVIVREEEERQRKEEKEQQEAAALKEEEEKRALRLRDLAAVRIQAVARGHRGRMLFNEVKGGYNGIQEESSLESLGEELLISSKEMLQRLPSGARRELRRAVASGDSQLVHLIREACALTIQCALRGKFARTQMQNRMTEMVKEDFVEDGQHQAEELLISSKEMLQRLPSGARRELRRAVASGDSQLVHLIRGVCSLTIQCALRGKFARTQMQNRMTEMVKEDFVEDGQYQAAVDETAGWDRQRSAREAVEASQSEGEVELWDAGERKYTEEIAPTVGSAEADTDGSQHSVTVQREPSAEKPRLSKVHVVMKPRKSAWTARVEKERSESPPPLDRAARIREYSENHRQKKQAAAARREAEHRLQEGFSSPTGFQPHLYTSQSYRYDSPHARRPDGQVMLRYENGDSYEGGWSNNHPEGYGTFVWAEGDRYTGQWKAGRRHGQGEYDWADGSKFTGWWLQGKQGGKGCFEWPDGRAYSGVWTARPDGMEKHTREVRERRVYTSKTKIGGCTIQRRESSLASWTPEKAKEMAKSQSRSRASSPSRPGTAASYASQAETASPANSRPITAEGTLRPGLKEERPAEFGKGGKAKKRVNTSLSSSTSTLGKIRHVRDPLDRGGGRATPGEGGETLFKLLLDDGDQRVGSQISEENLEWNMDNLETIYAYDVKAAYQRSPRPSYAPSSSSSVRRLYTALSASSNVSDPLPMPRVFKMFDSPQGDPRPSIQGMLSEMQQSISPFQSQTPPRSAPSALHVRSPPPTAPDLKSPQSPIRTPPGFASPSRRKLTRSETFLMLDHVRQHEKAIEHAKESRNAVRDLLEDEARAIKMGQRGDSKLSMLFGKFSEGGESDVQNGVMGQRFFLDCLTSLGVVGGAKVDEHGGVEHIEGVVKKQDAIDLFNSCRRSSSRSVERHRMTIQDFRVAMDKLNDILDGKCFQKLAPAVLRQQSMMSPTASRFSAPAAASGSPEMKELHRLIERQKRGNPPFGWGADIVARNRKKNLFFDNPFHDPLFEFEQVRSYM